MGTWMLHVAVVGMLLCLAAIFADRVAARTGRPRRWVWASAMLLSVALPLIGLGAPGVLPRSGWIPDGVGAIGWLEEGALSGVLLERAGQSDGRAGAATHLSEWLSTAWLGALWAGTSLIMLGLIALTYRRLRLLKAGCRRAEVDGIPVLVSEVAGPAVVGLVTPEILIPRWVLESCPEERRMILEHERQHLVRGDPWLLLLGAVVLAVMPWSPALWWQQSRLRAAIEMDCDTRVVAGGIDPRRYGQALIRTAGRPAWIGLFSTAWHQSTSHLEHRIMALTAARRGGRLRSSAPAITLAAVLVLVACDLSGRESPLEAGQGSSGSSAPSSVPESPGPGETTVIAMGGGRYVLDGEAEVVTRAALQARLREKAAGLAGDRKVITVYLHRDVPEQGRGYEAVVALNTATLAGYTEGRGFDGYSEDHSFEARSAWIPLAPMNLLDHLRAMRSQAASTPDTVLR